MEKRHLRPPVESEIFRLQLVRIDVLILTRQGEHCQTWYLDGWYFGDVVGSWCHWFLAVRSLRHCSLLLHPHNSWLLLPHTWSINRRNIISQSIKTSNIPSLKSQNDAVVVWTDFLCSEMACRLLVGVLVVELCKQTFNDWFQTQLGSYFFQGVIFQIW